MYWTQAGGRGPLRCDEGLFLYVNAAGDAWKLVDGRLFRGDAVGEELAVVGEMPMREMDDPTAPPTEWACELGRQHLGLGGDS